jgi:ABC-type cobalamin/Fe3+-siderophores transport system ATPase subunit
MEEATGSASPPDSRPALFLSKEGAEGSGSDAVVVPSSDRWNDFGYVVLADIGLRGPSGEMEWFAGRFAVQGEKSLRDFASSAGADETTGIPLSQLGKPYASLLGEIKHYSLARRALGSARASALLRELHDVSLLSEEEATVPDWPEFFESEVFTMAFLRSSESYLAFRQGAWVLAGRATSNIDSQQPFAATLRTGPRVRFDFKFDAQNVFRGRIAVLIGANGSGKTTALAVLARGLADSKALAVAIDQRPQVNQVLAFAHSGAVALFRSRTKSAGSARVRVFALDPLGTRGRRRATEPDTRLLVDIARASDEEGQLLGYLKSLLDDEFPSLRMQVPIKQSTGEGGRSTAYKSLARWMRGSEQRQLEAAAEIDHSRPLKYFDADGKPRTPSLGQRTFIRFALTALANAGPASVLLIDEPENFLHPNLISRFMQVLHRVLTGTRSIALIATHSPFVVREVQSAQVHVITRIDGLMQVAKPRLQTLGANVANISDEVFGDDLPRHLHEELLAQANIQGMSFPDALDAYAHELSTEALMMLRSKVQGET